jgi:flagellar motor switch/type III secretory pathway protein FliN
MATLQSIAPPVPGAAHQAAAGFQVLAEPGRNSPDEQALVATAHDAERPAIALTAQVARLPVELDVAVPVRNFRVRNLLNLEPSSLIESGWGHGEDVPLAAGAVQLAWCEFEVIDTDLAVRVTRLA